jgi:hypothetical protein
MTSENFCTNRIKASLFPIYQPIHFQRCVKKTIEIRRSSACVDRHCRCIARGVNRIDQPKTERDCVYWRALSSRRARWLLAFLFVGTLGCRAEDSTAPKSSKTAIKTTTKANSLEAPVTKEETSNRRLPAPLMPRARPVSGFAEEREHPCDGLVDRVCALLGQGSEECGEARNRLERRGPDLREDRCQGALDWYRTHVEGGRRSRPCRTLAATLCQKNGPATNSCVTATERAKKGGHDERSKAACRAELLLMKGFL